MIWGLFLATTACDIGYDTNTSSLLQGSAHASDRKCHYKILMHLHTGSVILDSPFGDTVMILLALMDSCGIAQRKRRKLKRRIYHKVCLILQLHFNVYTYLSIIHGDTNFLWHCHRYDKLKLFGIAIHGCIDAYGPYT